jgi:spore coat protein U-like protein
MCAYPIRKSPLRLEFGASAIVTIVVLLGLATPSIAAKSTLTVTAQVLNKTGCGFISPTTPMNFGNIDPSLASNATATANIVIRCSGSNGNTAIQIARDAGQHVAANNLRMQHATAGTNFLPYSLNLAGVTWAVGLVIVGNIANNSNFSFNLGGTVLPIDYQNALLGSYSDNVILTITP